MAKIRVEIEVKVPDGKYCKTCEYCKYVSSDLAICNPFGYTTPLHAPDRYPERCNECKQAGKKARVKEQ